MSTLRAPIASGEEHELPKCKTLELGLDGFSECPYVGPTSCVHAVPFGYGFLCQNAGGGVTPLKTPGHNEAAARADSV